jgi:hypothetical protein
MRIRIIAPPKGGSKSIQRTANATRAAVEDMNIHYRCPDVTVEPGRSSSMSLFVGWPRLPFTARIERYVCSFQACLFSLQGWRLTDLPLRASNEGSPRPRVARAQKIIRLHPILCSASKKGTWPLPLCPSLRASDEHSFNYAPSTLTPPLTGGWPVWPPTARGFLTLPPTGTPRRAISPSEGFLRPCVARAKEANRLPSHSPFDRATLSWL